MAQTTQNGNAHDGQSKKQKLNELEIRLLRETVSELQETVKLLNDLRKGVREYHAVKSSSFIIHLN